MWIRQPRRSRQLLHIPNWIPPLTPLHIDDTPVASTHLGRSGEGKHSRNSVAEVWTWSWAGERISTSRVWPFPPRSGLSCFSACMSYGGIWKHNYEGYPGKIPCYYVKAPNLYRTEKVRANSASATFPTVHRVPLALSPCLLASSYLIITSSSLKRKQREGG